MKLYALRTLDALHKTFIRLKPASLFKLDAHMLSSFCTDFAVQQWILGTQDWATVLDIDSKHLRHGENR